MTDSRAALSRLHSPLVTTWPCFTEAMYFLGHRGGLSLQRLLWRYVETGNLAIYSNAETELPRIRQLMDKYHDLPMDLADATLVVAAEVLGLTQIFTIDSHFYAYRIYDKTSFEVLPG